MARRARVKTEGGHKRGHSNVAHWEPTQVIKDETKVARRHQDKDVVRKELLRDGGAWARILRRSDELREEMVEWLDERLPGTVKLPYLPGGTHPPINEEDIRKELELFYNEGTCRLPSEEMRRAMLRLIKKRGR